MMNDLKKLTRLHPVAIGLAVRNLRELAKITANDLAVQVGLHPSAISRVENGLRGLELQDAVLITQVLGTDINQLLQTATNMQATGIVSEHIDAVDQLKGAIDKARQATQSAIDATIQFKEGP